MNFKKTILFILVALNIFILSSFQFKYVDNTIKEVHEIQDAAIKKINQSFFQNETNYLTEEDLKFINELQGENIKIKFSDLKKEYDEVGTQHFIVTILEAVFGLKVEIVEDESLADVSFVVADEYLNYDYTSNPFHNLSTIVFYDYTNVTINDLQNPNSTIGIDPYLYDYLDDEYKEDFIPMKFYEAENKLSRNELDFYYSLPYEKIDILKSSQIISSIQYLTTMNQISLRLATDDDNLKQLLNITDKFMLNIGHDYLEESVINEIKVLSEKYFYNNLTTEQLSFLESDYVVKFIIEERANIAFYDKFGNPAGYVIDYLNLVSEKTNMDIDIEIINEISDDSELLLTLENDYDVLPLIKFNKNEIPDNEKYSITESFLREEIYVLKRLGVDKIPNVNSLVYKKVGILHSPVIDKFLENRLSSKLKNVTYYKRYSDLILAFENNIIDYAVVEPGFINYTFENSNLILNVATTKESITDFYMLVSSHSESNDNTKVISEILSKSFVIIDDEEIKNEWFSDNVFYDKKSNISYKLKDVSIIGSILITIILTFFIAFARNVYKSKKEIENIMYINNTTGKFNNLALQKYMLEVDDFTLITLDIQQFKYINDIYGTKTADLVFKTFSNTFAYLEDRWPFLTFTPNGGVVTICITEKDDSKINKFVGEIRLIVQHINLYDDLGYNVKVKMAVIDKQFTKNKENISQYIKQLLNYSKENNQIFARYNKDYESKFNINKEIEKILLEEMNDKVVPFFQPFICSKTEKVIGCETLARIKDEDKMYFPDTFLPIAVETGTMAQMDEALFKRTVEIRKELLEKNIISEDFYFSVNISVPFLRKLDVKKLMDLRDELNVKDFSFLQIEILEDQLSKKEIKNILNIIELFNIKIAIDDFSAGHSSIFRVGNFPCDVLKIDKGLLPIDFKKIHEEKYVTVLSLVNKDNRLQITCEGVETKEHVDFLKKLPVDVFQGYYYSRPVNIETFTNYIIERNNI